MSNGDPDFPPEPPSDKCTSEHDNAVSKYFDMKKAESDAINAMRKAKNAALSAGGVCAVGAVFPANPACVVALGAVIALLDDARAKNDLFAIAIQQYIQTKQTLLDCISLAEITVQ
jgi:hypothetical protein